MKVGNNSSDTSISKVTSVSLFQGLCRGEPGNGTSLVSEPGNGTSLQFEPGNGTSLQSEPGNGTSLQLEPGNGTSSGYIKGFMPCHIPKLKKKSSGMMANVILQSTHSMIMAWWCLNIARPERLG